MFDQSKLMRGTLEGCILKIISAHETYGYEIVSKMQLFGFKDVKEGTIYPLLMRLEKKSMIKSRFCSSPLGPSRKYYSITDEGTALLEAFVKSWKTVSVAVEYVLSNGGEDFEN